MRVSEVDPDDSLKKLGAQVQSAVLKCAEKIGVEVAGMTSDEASGIAGYLAQIGDDDDFYRRTGLDNPPPGSKKNKKDPVQL